MPSRRRAIGRLTAVFVAIVAGIVRRARSQTPPAEERRAFTVTARRYQFEPDVLDVRLNDVVRLTITSEDIAHSFTVDAYRIQKRIPPGGSTTFEFRAEEAGRFPYYCSMRAESGCAEMRGELIVR